MNSRSQTGHYEPADDLAAALARSEANVRAAYGAASMDAHHVAAAAAAGGGAAGLSHLAPRPNVGGPAPSSSAALMGGNRVTLPEYTPLRIPPPGMALPSMENVQLTGIVEPQSNDVLCGRGGGTNNHLGNEKFRDLVNSQKVLYLHSSKRDKPFVSRAIVRAVRAQTPPGRFLQKDESTGLYYDIGDQKAREKTSQALREGAPEIRNQLSSPVKPSHQKMRRAAGLAAQSPGGGMPTSPQTAPQAADYGDAAMYLPTGEAGTAAGIEAAMARAAAANAVAGHSYGAMDRSALMDASGRHQAQMLSEEARTVAALGGSAYGHMFAAHGAAAGPPLPMSLDRARAMETELRALTGHIPSDPRLSSAAAAAYLTRGNNGPTGEVPEMDGRDRRLEFAEIVAQRTVNGSISEELRAEEKRMSLYMDAGLLGISTSELAERVARGETEFVIVEQKYNDLKDKAEDEEQQDGGKKAGSKRASDTESLSALDKKARLYGASSVKGHPVLSERHIQEALMAIGGAV